jgi:hypothetical protein
MDCASAHWLFDKDVRVKHFTANRRSFWRAAAFGGTVSAMFLAGCANSSQGLLSWLNGRKGEPAAARQTPLRDPFLDIENQRLASADADRRDSDSQYQRWEREQSTRCAAIARRSSISDRFDHNRVATTGEPRETRRFPAGDSDARSGRAIPVQRSAAQTDSVIASGSDPFLALEQHRESQATAGQPARSAAANRQATLTAGRRDVSPFPGLDRGQRNPFVTAELSRDVRRTTTQRNDRIVHSGTNAAPFPMLPTPGAGVRGDRDDVTRASLTKHGRGLATDGTMIVDTKSATEQRPITLEIRPKPRKKTPRPEPIEIQIIPRNSAAPVMKRDRSQPSDVDHRRDSRSESPCPVVQISATGDVAATAARKSERELQWRAISVRTENTLPAPGDGKRAAPLTPDETPPPFPSGNPAAASTAELPLPAEAKDPAQATQTPEELSDAHVAVDDETADDPAAADAQPGSRGRWVLIGCGVLAFGFFLLRRRRRTVAT